MSRSKLICALAAAVIAVAGLSTRAAAQQGGGNRPTREEMQQRADTQMKTSLGVTDEQWKELKPKVDKVQTLSRQMRGGGRMFGRMGGGAAAPEPTTDIEKKKAELQKVLDNKEAKEEDVSAALLAYREVRAKIKTELEAAQKELLKGLTPKQEAALVNQGLIE